MAAWMAAVLAANAASLEPPPGVTRSPVLLVQCVTPKCAASTTVGTAVVRPVTAVLQADAPPPA